MLSFESIYTRKVGGLAEVPPRLGKALMDKGHEVYILTPNHGFLSEISDEHDKYLEELLNVSINNINYRIILYTKPGVPHIILSGGVLDHPEVYAPETFYEKVFVQARLIKLFAESKPDYKPDIVHGNDWHSVPSLLVLNTLFKRSIKYYYQIHLLSKTVFNLEDLSYRLGLDPHTIIYGVKGSDTIAKYYEYSKGLADRLGALISNKVLTVSKNYAKTVIRKLGFDLEHHVDYIPNATTWDINNIVQDIIHIHPELTNAITSYKDILGQKRHIIRKYFELEAIGKIPSTEPIIDDKDFREFITRIDTYPFKLGGRLYPYPDEGPLVIMTGRLSRQKGIHLLLKIIDELTIHVPNIRIMLMLIPVWGEAKLAEELINYSITLPDNLRVLFGKSRTLFYLAHIAGDVMIIPSIYEPFGLVALEGMLTGNSIVASRTGGLAETVLDIRIHGVKGTGLHVTPGDPEDLALKITDMVLFMESGYYKAWSKEWWRIVSRITDRKLRELLLSNTDTPWIIRLSSHSRALEYTWDKSAEKALRIYTG